MKRKELFDYIKNRKYLCCFCQNLQKQVIEVGVDAIKSYNGMICGSVEDMMIRYYEMVNDGGTKT